MPALRAPAVRGLPPLSARDLVGWSRVTGTRKRCPREEASKNKKTEEREQGSKLLQMLEAESLSQHTRDNAHLEEGGLGADDLQGCLETVRAHVH